MLKQQTDPCDSKPAAKPYKERFSAGFYKFYDIGIKPDCRHGQYNKKLGKFFNRSEELRRYSKRYRSGGYDRRADKVKNKERENLLDTDRLSVGSLSFLCSEKGQSQGDGDNRKGTGQLDSDSFIKSSAA